jgi:hypothetical protein
VAGTPLGDATTTVATQRLRGSLNDDFRRRQVACCTRGAEVWGEGDMMTALVRAGTFDAERVADEEAA